jgi:hypothetical protein
MGQKGEGNLFFILGESNRKQIDSYLIAKYVASSPMIGEVVCTEPSSYTFLSMLAIACFK